LVGQVNLQFHNVAGMMRRMTKDWNLGHKAPDVSWVEITQREDRDLMFEGVLHLF
jgi:hypothetical protein